MDQERLHSDNARVALDAIAGALEATARYVRGLIEPEAASAMDADFRGDLIALGKCAAMFPGETRKAQLDAARQWWESLHPAERVHDEERFVVRSAILPDGFAAGASRRSRGRPKARIAGFVWKAYLAQRLDRGATVVAATAAARKLASERGAWCPTRRTLAKRFDQFEGAYRYVLSLGVAQ